MVHHRDGGQFSTVDQFEDVHANETLGHNDQHIPHGDNGSRCERRSKCCFKESDIDEWVNCQDQDDQFGGTGDMVIDEATTIDFVELRVG
jgi:hypothetical protein